MSSHSDPIDIPNPESTTPTPRPTLEGSPHPPPSPLDLCPHTIYPFRAQPQSQPVAAPVRRHSSPADLPLRPSPDPNIPTAYSPPLATLGTAAVALAALPMLDFHLAQYAYGRATNTLPPVGIRTFLMSRYARHLLGNAPWSAGAVAAHIPARATKTATEAGLRIDAVDIPPAPEEVLRGIARPHGMTPVLRPGIVIGLDEEKKGVQRAADGERLLLWFHGGGYTRGDVLASEWPVRVARDANVRMLGVSYRLAALSAQDAFPAPLLDALSAWHYATSSLGFKPSNIVLVGASVGGHLALTLSNHLASLDPATLGHTTLTPGGLALSSPRADHTTTSPSWHTKLDYLSRSASLAAAHAIARHYPAGALQAVLFSPSRAAAGYWAYLASTPVFIAAGTGEALWDEINALVKGMTRDGVAVDFYAEENGLHCGPLLPWRQLEYDRWMAGVRAVVGKVGDPVGSSEVAVV